MNNGLVTIGRLNIWFVLGLALCLRTLLPISGYLYTRDATIFYTPDTASYIVPARELIVHHRFFLLEHRKSFEPLVILCCSQLACCWVGSNLPRSRSKSYSVASRY